MNSPFTKRVTFLHTGHIGDIIAFLPVFHHLKGTTLIIRDEPWMAPMSGYKYDSIRPLLHSQGIEVYLNTAKYPLDYDVSDWRQCYRDDLSLMDAQARYLNVVDRNTGHLKVNVPWIAVTESPLTKDRVIFNRTPRYRNAAFPWRNVLKHYGDKALFIGTEDEHSDFCNEVGKIERFIVPDCLEVARAIAGADSFVGNQSSAFWIAAALRKPLIQEVYLPAPNSVVKYDGAYYSFDGSLPF
jgi:hypothetical protein